jgi:hypothetical protein
MTNRIPLGRLAALCAVMLLALLALCAGTAAAEPVLSITQPEAGARLAAAKPSFQGTTEDALDVVTVDLYEGSGSDRELLQSFEALPVEDAWQTPASHTLADGIYTAIAHQPDGLEPLESQITFTVDTTGPGVTLTPPATPSRQARPTIAGGLGQATGDLQSVTVEIDGEHGETVSEGSASVSGASWSYTPAAALPDGSYTVRASQLDDLGNSGQAGPAALVIDTTPPAATISSPVNSSVVHVTRPTFAGAGGTASGDHAGVVLKIYENTVTSGAPEQSLSLTVAGGKWSSGSSGPQLPNGLYTAVVEQEDDAGNIKSAATVFLVSTASPTVTMEPVGMVERGESSFSNARPHFSGEAGTEPEDAASVTLKIYHGTSASGSPYVSSTGAVSGSRWSSGPASALPDGTYTAQAEQSNETLAPGVSAPVTFTVDADAPDVSVSLPANGSTTAGSTVHVSGAAGTDEGDSASVTVALYEGSSIGGSAPLETVTVPSAGGKWSTTFGGLSPGAYTTRAQQRDDVGNVGTSAAATFTVPDPPLTILGVGAVQRNGKTIMPATQSFSGTAPGSATVAVGLYAGTSVSGSPIRTLDSAVSGTSWSAGPVSPALPEGTYTARATEPEGGHTTVSEPPLTFTVDADAPHVTLTSPANGSTTASSSQPVSGAAGTAPGDSQTVTAQLFSGAAVGSQSPLESISVTVASGAWSTAFGALSPGTYTARAQQSDDVGNVGTSAPVTFTVAGAGPPPGPPSASFRWFPSAPHVGEPVSLVSTSTDPGAPITSYAWSLSATGPLAPGGSVLNTTFSTPGAHVVRLSVTDAAGLTSAVSETVTVAPRAISLIQPFPVVRIAGSESARGVRIKLFSVQTPAGSRISVHCRGHGCPAHAQSFLASAKGKQKAGAVIVVLRRFERSLRAGAVVEVKVSRPGQIGKYTRFTVRRGKLPLRQDRCLSPSGEKPMECPS